MMNSLKYLCLLLYCAVSAAAVVNNNSRTDIETWLMKCEQTKPVINRKIKHVRNIEDDPRAEKGIVNSLLYKQYISNSELHGTTLKKIESFFGEKFVENNRYGSGGNVLPTMLVIGSGTPKEQGNMFDPLLSDQWRMILFEIIPSFVEAISARIATLAPDLWSRVQLFPCGVGETEMKIETNYSYHGIVGFNEKVIPLDHVLHHQVAFANIDIDQNWPGFVAGASRVFREGLIPVVLLETVLLPHNENATEYLKKLAEHYYLFDTNWICFNHEPYWKDQHSKTRMHYHLQAEERPGEVDKYYEHYYAVKEAQKCNPAWTHLVGVHHDYLTTEHLDFLENLGCGYCRTKKLLAREDYKNYFRDMELQAKGHNSTK